MTATTFHREPIAPLFSAKGDTRLTEIVQPGMLCVFDFDGTLAPIVAQPDQACLPSEVRQRLCALQTLTPVAILTGRSLDDINGRLDFCPNFVVGNHGLEGLPNSAERRATYEKECAAWKLQIESAFSGHQSFDSALLVEDKKISLSVHYRHVANQDQSQSQLIELFAKLAPRPRLIAGKYVFNLLPQGAGDKGTAFEELMRLSSAPSAIYVGDDVTDEDVFALPRRDLLTIKIGDQSASTPSAAAYMVPEYVDILQILDDLIRRLTNF